MVNLSQVNRINRQTKCSRTKRSKHRRIQRAVLNCYVFSSNPRRWVTLIVARLDGIVSSGGQHAAAWLYQLCHADRVSCATLGSRASNGESTRVKPICTKIRSRYNIILLVGLGRAVSTLSGAQRQRAYSHTGVLTASRTKARATVSLASLVTNAFILFHGAESAIVVPTISAGGWWLGIMLLEDFVRHSSKANFSAQLRLLATEQTSIKSNTFYTVFVQK
jgi:hypothetical protein